MFKKLKKLFKDFKGNRKGFILVWLIYPLGQILVIVLSTASKTNWAGWVINAYMGSPWYPFG